MADVNPEYTYVYNPGKAPHIIGNIYTVPPQNYGLMRTDQVPIAQSPPLIVEDTHGFPELWQRYNMPASVQSGGDETTN